MATAYITLLIAVLGGSSGCAQVAFGGLSPEETRVAQQVESEVFDSMRSLGPGAVLLQEAIPWLDSTAAGSAGLSIVTLVSQSGSPATRRDDGPRQAWVTRFDYPTGVTIRTLVDLNRQKAVSVKAAALEPTPLAEVELKQAIEIARTNSTSLEEILAFAPEDEWRFDVLTPIDSSPASPQFGHRLVLLRTTSPTLSEKLLIDLSDRVLVVEEGGE